MAKLFTLAWDGIFAFSTIPLRIISYLGLLISCSALIGIIAILVQRIFVKQFEAIGLAPVPGFATIVIAVLFLGGIQLLCIGIIGEYIGRIYEEVKNRPKWVLKSTIGVQVSSDNGI